MKEFWVVVVDKSKEVEASALLIGVGIFGICTMIIVGIVTVDMFKYTVKAIELITAHGTNPM